MENVIPERDVVAALIWREGKFLICQRPEGKKRGLLWEFVGGKTEPGETKEEALKRECKEELDITVAVGSEFMTVTHEYPDILIHLTLFHTVITEGEPKLLEHNASAWITPAEVPNYDFCPADVDILSRITELLGKYRYFGAPLHPEVHVFSPTEEVCADSRILYLHSSFEEALKVWECLPAPKPVLAVLDGADWYADLSPWPSSKNPGFGEDFAGRGPEYLKNLLENVIPTVENALEPKPTHRGIAGYSLAGLFALWSAYRCEAFEFAASLSGSLWFDGFVDYLRENKPSDKLEWVYLSLGDREKNAKNPRMAKVEDCTAETETILREKGIYCEFEKNPGGHFNNVAERIVKGCSRFTCLGE